MLMLHLGLMLGGVSMFSPSPHLKSLALDSVESQNETTVGACLGLRCFQKGFWGTLQTLGAGSLGFFTGFRV